MTSRFEFSVIIPTLNRAELLSRALRSVECQDFRDFEIIVVDDGSTGVIGEMPAVSAHHRMIRNDHTMGVAAARNRGISAASGEFLVFLDDDDTLRPEALSLIHARLQSSPEIDFLWGARIIHEFDTDGREIGLRRDDWSRLPKSVSGPSFLTLILEIASSAAFCIRRSTLEQLGGFDEHLRVSEDRDLFVRLARGGHMGGAVSQCIIEVYELHDSLSRGDGSHLSAEFDMRVIDKHYDYLTGPQTSQFLNNYLTAIYASFLRAGNRREAMRMLNELRRRDGLNLGVVRQYVRHAPVFRALKALFRYDFVRRIRHRLRL